MTELIATMETIMGELNENKEVKESTSGNQESHSKQRLATENPLAENTTAQESEPTSGQSEIKTEPKTAEENKEAKESTSGNQESHSKQRLATENPLAENSTAQKSEPTSGQSEIKTELKTAQEKAEIKNAYTKIKFHWEEMPKKLKLIPESHIVLKLAAKEKFAKYNKAKAEKAEDTHNAKPEIGDVRRYYEKEQKRYITVAIIRAKGVPVTLENLKLEPPLQNGSTTGNSRAPRNVNHQPETVGRHGSPSRARRAISEFTDSGACMVPSSELVENRILQKLREFLEVETS